MCQIDHGGEERTTEHKLERGVPNRSLRGREDDRKQAGKTCAKWIMERKRGRLNTSWKDVCQIDHGEDDRTQAGKTCAK